MPMWTHKFSNLRQALIMDSSFDPQVINKIFDLHPILVHWLAPWPMHLLLYLLSQGSWTNWSHVFFSTVFPDSTVSVRFDFLKGFSSLRSIQLNWRSPIFSFRINWPGSLLPDEQTEYSRSVLWSIGITQLFGRVHEVPFLHHFRSFLLAHWDMPLHNFFSSTQELIKSKKKYGKKLIL